VKTTQQTIENADDATPMELALATLEMMAAAARMAVAQGNEQALSEALANSIRTAQMIQRWIADNDPKAKA
jgi:hypothetical protein